MNLTHNIKCIVSYDGTNYHGFQKQKSGIKTIGEYLEKAITKVANHPIEIICAGRTDRGVHAEGQVINFKTTQKLLKEHNWIRALNSMLPIDIRIIDCVFVEENFSSRFDAVAREYWYYIYNVRYPDAVKLRFSAHFRDVLNIELLNQYCSCCVGNHDFSSFCSTLDVTPIKNKIIYSYKAVKEGDFVIFKIIGSSFLHNMVRILSGTLIQLNKLNAPKERMNEIILSKNRILAGKTIIPDGLIFKRVYYNKDEIPND